MTTGDASDLPIAESARELADEAVDFGSELGVASERLDDGATVIDFGVATPGSLDAGLLLAALRRGGLLAAEVRIDRVGTHTWPVVEGISSHPGTASVIADPHVQAGPPLSGPGPAGYGDLVHVAVSEATGRPDASDTEAIAQAIGVGTDALYVAVVPPGSVAWTVDAAVAALDDAVAAVADVADGRVAEAMVAAPVPPATDDAAQARDLAAACRRRGGRAHVRLADGTAASQVADALDHRDGPGAVTIVDAQGAAATVGETDEAGLLERLQACG